MECLKEISPYLVAFRDSIFQFELMTIKEDYEKAAHGGDHLSRELQSQYTSKKAGSCSVNVRKVQTTRTNREINQRYFSSGGAFEMPRLVFFF